MLPPAPRIFGKSGSLRAEIGIGEIYALTVAARTPKQMRDVLKQCAVLWTEFVSKCLHIQISTVITRQTVRRDVLTALQTITKRCVRDVIAHTSLQGWLSYTVNETETNHFSNHGRGE